MVSGWMMFYVIYTLRNISFFESRKFSKGETAIKVKELIESH
jgi:hypothetical protein